MSSHIHPGDRVKVLTIPESLTRDLPAEDMARLRATKGKVVTVVRHMPHGYLWLSFTDGTEGFSLQPQDVQVVKESKQ
jgi:hypothetical protein